MESSIKQQIAQLETEIGELATEKDNLGLTGYFVPEIDQVIEEKELEIARLEHS